MRSSNLFRISHRIFMVSQKINPSLLVLTSQQSNSNQISRSESETETKSENYSMNIHRQMSAPAAPASSPADAYFWRYSNFAPC